MIYVNLGSIVDVSKGKKHNPAEIPTENSKRIIGIDDLRNDTNIVLTNDQSGIEAFLNDVLIAWDGANAGTIGYEKKGYIGSTIARLRIKHTQQYNEVFLGKLLQSKFRFLRAMSTGATIPHVNRAALDSIKVPQFSINDQIRIATVLTRAEKLIAKRKESIKALDELLKSTFLEMFGDPVRNEKGWKRIPFSEILTKIESGHSPVCLDRPTNPGEWGILKLGAVTQCIFKSNENKALPESEKPNPEIEIRDGDILFSRKNTYDLVAACVYIWKTPPRLMMSDLIFRFVLSNKNIINPIYLQALLSFSTKRKAIQKLAGGAAGSMPNISKSKLLEHKIEIPSIGLQSQFASIVTKTESLKSKYTQSLTELETLYASLSQRAFKGELDLSKIKP